ncbi:MAG: cobalamin biosynthesis protein, partial [Paracoccaceae bacterium]
AAGHEVVTLLPEETRGMQTLTRSAYALDTYRTGSVAEACALAAAGPGALLLGPRAISSDRMATCALARSRNTGDET